MLHQTRKHRNWWRDQEVNLHESSRRISDCLVTLTWKFKCSPGKQKKHINNSLAPIHKKTTKKQQNPPSSSGESEICTRRLGQRWRNSIDMTFWTTEERTRQSAVIRATMKPDGNYIVKSFLYQQRAVCKGGADSNETAINPDGKYPASIPQDLA